MDLESRMSGAVTTTGQGNLAERTFRRRTTEILQFTEKTWRWSYLKEQFRIADLENLYKRYTDKINNGYFSLFLILQCLLSLCHFFVVLVYNMENETLQRVVPDLILYAVAGVVPIVGIFLSESYVKKHPDVLNYASTAAFLLLFTLDVALPIYHNVQNEELGKLGIRPTYTTHLVLACHIFFTVRNTSTAMALGIFVSVTHIVVLIFFTYKNSPILIQRIIADSIYYLCINGVGAYFRFINEMMKRRGFLDRRACVQSNLELTFQKDQEEQLMLSIIPKSIIELVRKDISENFKSMKVQTKPFGNRYIVPHDNVTILYADIVNYTEMTTKLKPVTKLVETLNDLFGSFDDASEALKVLRIKFLGDCYYCVAGLPPDNIPNHADACVDLGLKMIKIIKRVRESRKLDINMRIGIHSGSILSGIIGIAKWQFDVWSKDVHIANKIESTGSPGKVHITKQTKDQLTKDYNIVPNSRCKTDPFLKQYNIETFLITPEKEPEEPPCAKVADVILNPCGLDKRRDTFQRKQDLRKVSSTPNLGKRLTSRRISGKFPLPNIEKKINNSERRMSGQNYRESLISGRMSDRNSLGGDQNRRTAFMDNNINIYQKRLQLTDEKLSEAIDSMPFAKYDQWIKKSDINPLLLVFKDLKKELNYFQIPDPLFRYYMLTELLILIGVLLIQNITVPHWDCTTFVGLGMMVFVIVILLPLTWSSYIWNTFYHKINNNDSVSYYDDSNLSDEPTAEVNIDDKPKNKFILLLYNISNAITINVFYRITIYLFICALFALFVFGDLFYCKYGDSAINLLKEKPVNDSTNNCFVPWHMTQTCGLAIVMSFLFLKVHVWIKFFYAATITILYSLFIYQVSDLFEESETLSFQIPTWIAHIISIVYLTFTLHLIDRQADYMNRLDHQWNLQLMKEQEEANFMRLINHYLLVNILPVHVAHRYLDVNRTKELYCEEYSDVAVMFASIVNYNLDDTEEKFFMHIMHEIIGDFDKLLVRDSKDKEKDKNKIEKIKVANWTYMAACGLAPGDSTYSVVDDETRKSYVVTLLSFAVEMRKVLKKHNRESLQDYQLRIGISHGEVTAGVVGSKKPLYDIWGDAVNIASRMDSTGESNRIQVTEETAMAIESSGYKCEFRDFIFVKGKSQNGIPDVPTYWVCLDDEDNLIPICNNEIDEEIS